MTTNSQAAPGWHPDPSNPSGALRWWDGHTWTAHTHPTGPTPPQAVAVAHAAAPVAGAPTAAWPGSSATITPSYGTASYGTASYGTASYGTASYGGSAYPSANVSFAKRNRHSLTAIGVVAVYVLLAVTTHFVLIGIVPIMLSIRAIKAKETLAPAAVAAAIVAVVVAFAALQ